LQIEMLKGIYDLKVLILLRPIILKEHVELSKSLPKEVDN